MPQLNPDPWLLIFAFSWLSFLALFPSKMLTYAFLWDPISQNMQNSYTLDWAWTQG
uniref:ATP synthase complex subunit 8 n=1 Tax=Moolgarda cunnesius TaxID=1111463 RepID=I1T2H9_MOOCU|nr:ATP synthase F0 subunit 8 [Moolgarda cunnesius]AEK53201.2 ATP synthase F0 subunit 8 [Moolgarda cunnesius]